MNSSPRWFWLAALVPLLNVVALIAVHRYDRAHPEELARWVSDESVGMMLSLYVAFILLLYLLFLLCWRKPPVKEPAPRSPRTSR